jgi:hypothetical protein
MKGCIPGKADRRREFRITKLRVKLVHESSAVVYDLSAVRHLDNNGVLVQLEPIQSFLDLSLQFFHLATQLFFFFRELVFFR